ncbi:hypothetical protein FC65_GL001845 [Ligilactobacillus acidipiscis DSM 15836]|uniref:Uncharacterized protein n=1 Tax=Ligilactobacillus acidipiscis DSM 15836 TaxID=1423716 RepID=A0ABR5PQ13_9LACO|nr:hypothetical protein [Ligilactobacillus acidipiscis]KRM31505.1 hypothetical protein FC65_GL001845 [Ligilactobacillus acidipiscis DSM 15836]GAW63157.1 putative secreted protein [Ligilactobacillus acidipiscis]GEN20099.1 hypothetical protein LAC02_33800 [Ligilactobacillus acidipiscis]
MIESIRLKRKEELPVSIGDVVQYHGGTFVIINILGIDVKSFRENDNNIFYYCLGQLYGSPDLAANYLTTENELNFSPDQYYNIPQVGDIFFDNTIGIWIRILEIRKVNFNDEGMQVQFKFSPVKEWSSEKMEKVFTASRARHMKLVKNDSVGL